MDLIVIDKDAKNTNSHANDVLKGIVKVLEKEFYKEPSIHIKIEIAKAVNLSYNTAISATQTAINGLKEQRLTEEFKMQYGGLGKIDI